MKFAFVMGFIFFTGNLRLAFASDNTNLSLIKVQVSYGSKIIPIYGHVVPDAGALHVQPSEVRGKVESVLVKQGDKVKRGQPVFRYKGSGCTSKEGCIISSSFDGVIDSVLKSTGSSIDVGEGVVSVLNLDEISIRLDVPIKYLNFVSVGDIIRMSVSQKESVAAEAKITEILAPTGIGETTRGLRTVLLSPLAGLQNDSVLVANLMVPLDGSGLKVPAKAVAYLDGHQYVIKKAQEKLQAVLVRVLSESGEFLWVSPTSNSLLKSGDSILEENAIFFLQQALEAKGRE
jgi:multidrug efflux pump subunit AcrA (membrane-fusion protein)